MYKTVVVRHLSIDESARVRRAAERTSEMDPDSIAITSAFVKVGRGEYAPARSEATVYDTVRGISIVVGRPVEYEIREYPN